MYLGFIGIDYAVIIRCRNINHTANRQLGAIVILQEHIPSSLWWRCRSAINLFQRGAIIECVFSNLSNAVANSYTCPRGYNALNATKLVKFSQMIALVGSCSGKKKKKSVTKRATTDFLELLLVKISQSSQSLCKEQAPQGCGCPQGFDCSQAVLQRCVAGQEKSR